MYVGMYGEREESVIDEKSKEGEKKREGENGIK